MGMKRMTKAEIVAKYTNVWDTPSSLRYQARLAYLDGRDAYCKELHRRANVLEKVRRERKVVGAAEMITDAIGEAILTTEMDMAPSVAKEMH